MNKRQQLLRESMVLLHDNTRSYVSRVTHVKRYRWEQSDHPPYNPNMSPSDFHAFGPLKKHLEGQYFNMDDEL